MQNNVHATTWEIEDIILGMAEIVVECRQLRRENEELRAFRAKYYEEVNQRCKDAQMHSANMLKLALVMKEKVLFVDEKEEFNNENN